MKRLVINACARKESNTYKLFEELVSQKEWTENDFEMVNLYEEKVPYLDEEMLDERNSSYLSRDGLIEKHFVEQFEKCNQVIFIYPTWNWNVPGILKAYIDLIFIANRTFAMKGLGTKGLTNVDQAVILNTTGAPKIPKAISYLFNVNTDIFYMKNMMKILGVKSILKVRLGSFGFKYTGKDELLKSDIEKVIKKNLNNIK